MLTDVVFWVAVCGVVYPYVGYPAVMWVLSLLVPARRAKGDTSALPSVSMIVPVHNEESRIAGKVANTAALRYPAGRLQVLYVSDGSTDRTVELLNAHASAPATIVELPERGGKAAALNAGLERATHEILVFSDASIELAPDALEAIVQGFADPRIGCVSGEDVIPESGGEAWYGRYELLLRRLESRVHSIVGASGSIYAQRRTLCAPFVEGMAPDFLSVLRTVEQGFRAVSEPRASGSMTAVKDPKHEFERKVRTLIRGMTTLFAHARVMNPFGFGVFAFSLVSHKVMRWAAPLFLVVAWAMPLLRLDSPLYVTAFAVQTLVYAGAVAAFGGWGRVHRTLPGKVALYFATVNVAALVAWVQYARGVRQELWAPSRR